MIKKMVLIGGAVNALFVLFHIYLTYACWTFVGTSSEIRGLLTMLNVGGVLLILFFTLAFLLHPAETSGTKIGRLALLFCTLLYGTRAIEEVILTSGRPSWLILTVCAATTALFIFICTKARRASAAQ